MMPLNRHYTRRELLARAGSGFGVLGLAGLLRDAGLLAADASDASDASATRPKPHFAPRAKRVIFLYMTGGPSQLDTFDPKPKLMECRDQHPSFKLKNRKYDGHGFQPSPFKFRRHGESGTWVSELFPRTARCVDDICMIRSMVTDLPVHESANFMMNCGTVLDNRPALGSWLSYGLGSLNENFPGFVVLSPFFPTCGESLWSNSFLPSSNQGTRLNTAKVRVEDMISNLRPADPSQGGRTPAEQRRQLALLRSLEANRRSRSGADDAFEAQIRSLEMAFQLQTEGSEACDLSHEPQSIRELYGEGEFSRSCLLARRLVERGVRCVQVFYTQTPTTKSKLIGESANQPWDTHSRSEGKLRRLARDSDRPVAALLTDLKQRGMLDDTLVIWGGEFGRTPWVHNKSPIGRDHHSNGFTTWLAGGGVRGGTTYGETDELGTMAIENPVHVHDLHATILHLMGIDHTRLVYRYSGRDFRLTDVHGKVVKDILA
jgi:hypothetical protein